MIDLGAGASWPDDYRAGDLTRDDLDAMADAPLPVEPPGKPTDLFLVLDDGTRVSIDLRYGCTVGNTIHWYPMIDSAMSKLMPRVVQLVGPPLLGGHALTFREVGPGWNTQEWVSRLMANSRDTLTCSTARYDATPQDVYPEGAHT